MISDGHDNIINFKNKKNNKFYITVIFEANFWAEYEVIFTLEIYKFRVHAIIDLLTIMFRLILDRISDMESICKF